MSRRIIICAVAAVFIAAMGTPVRAQEIWDETLKNTLSSWWSSTRDQDSTNLGARRLPRKRRSGVTGVTFHGHNVGLEGQG